MREMDYPTDPAAELLCRLLSLSPSAGCDLKAEGLDWPKFTALVEGQWLSGPVYLLRRNELANLGIPAQQVKMLRLDYLRQVSAAERRRFWLGRLLQKMASRGMAVIALKGTFLAEVVYADPVMRPMEDIDLLVHPGDLPAALTVLKELGYGPQKGFWLEMELKDGHELPLLIQPGAPPVELHWRLFDPGSPFQVDLDGLWRRALPVTIYEAAALGLCPEDTLLYLCLHSAHHRLKNQLRGLYDIALTVDHYLSELDWDQFLERLREWHGERAAFLLLWLAADLLHAHIPGMVLDNLRPADFSPAQAEAARQLVLSLPVDEAVVPPHLAALNSTRGLRARLSLVFSQLFLPIPVMRREYGVAPGSWRVLLYYPVRWWSLLKRGLRPAWRLLRGEQKTRRQAEAGFERQQKEEMLAVWLGDR